MAATAKRFIAKSVNKAIAPLGIRIARLHDRSDPKAFLPFEETLEAARRAGMTVGDYVEAMFNVPGTTAETIDGLDGLGVFDGPVDTVVEIGPGTGRYLTRVLDVCTPSRYEIYETAEQWAKFLEQNYEVVRQPVDGVSLAATPSGSADLVQAHKVFVITPFLTTCRYWLEMLRVSRPAARVVFDIVTEECMGRTLLDRWLESRQADELFPAVVPRQYAVDFFTSRGATLLGSFRIAMKPGETEMLAFRVDRG